MKLSTAAVAGAFLAVSIAGSAQAQTAPDFPDEACASWIEQGTDNGECRTSVAFWADRLAADVENRLTDSEKYTQYGLADSARSYRQPEGLPSMNGNLYAANIGAACSPIRSLDTQATDMRGTVMAADSCLAAAYMFASRVNMLETYDIELAGGVLALIDGKLPAEQGTEPAP